MTIHRGVALITVLVIIAGLVVLGGGAYIFTHKRALENPIPITSQTHTQTAPGDHPEVDQPAEADPGIGDASVPASTELTTTNGFSFSWPYLSTMSTTVSSNKTSHNIELRVSYSEKPVATIECGTTGNYEGPYESKTLTNEHKSISVGGTTYTVSYGEYEYVNGATPATGVPSEIRIDVRADKFKNDATVTWHAENCKLQAVSEKGFTPELRTALKEVYSSWK